MSIFEVDDLNVLEILNIRNILDVVLSLVHSCFFDKVWIARFMGLFGAGSVSKEEGFRFFDLSLRAICGTMTEF